MSSYQLDLIRNVLSASIINWYCLSYFQAKGQTVVKVTQIQNVCFEQGWFNDAVGQ